ncbi:DUF5916 domain-containing protein [Flagellimonas sp. S3867]|uniref:DUF5916 domain-containing protein n=1 Tax=Flagellimonas sp. S3867 TaxID=2768063 RepID=UPI0016863157|nr:DUF5916 domain-containing protein [Flagellimonas sp. S3867]
MKQHVIILASAVLFSYSFCQAQEALNIKKASGKIAVDAIMDEADWKIADVAQNFWQYFPSDSVHAQADTEVRLIYDQNYLYVLAKMYNLGERSYVTPSLRRDFRGEANDVFSIVLDTYADKNNAFLFGVNPFGVQREGLIANGGSLASPSTFSTGWDNVWYSEAKIYDGFWMVEMAIPLKTLRYKKGSPAWNINFYRFDSEYAEQSTWTRIPRNQFIINLAFTKELIWDQPLNQSKKNISLIPYGIYRNSKDFEQDTPTSNEFDFGLDTKIGLGPAMTLDLTVNPDFSQVEVDQQVTNLDRFEIFFPERRQFFLENADLFANFGIDGTRPFFSRRIGVSVDTSTGQNLQNRIYGGFRLNGKLNKNLRIGLLDTQLEENKTIQLPSTNYFVAAMQQRFLSRSNVGVFFINKQAFTDSVGGDFDLSPSQYNRALGLDVNLASNDNTWNSKFFYHQSFDPNNSTSEFATGGFINYNSYRWESNFTLQSIGSGYNPEVGFVRRRNIFQANPEVWLNIYPKKGSIQRHGPGISADWVGNNRNFNDLDWNYGFNYRTNFKNTAILNFSALRQYTYLLNPFDPSGLNTLPLAANSEYAFSYLTADFRSDARKKLSYNLSTRLGEYFNGNLYNIGGTFTYRYQPLGFASLNFMYNRIRLPDGFNDSDLLLIGTRFDFTFTKNFFLTTFVQLNSQIENLNINTRLQWRFKPVSDLFLVYTDNYFAESLSPRGGLLFPDIRIPRQRAIVLKLNYWLNL